LRVPRDCVASETTKDRAFALRHMKVRLRADTRAFDAKRTLRK
jgi:hypothetical protein